MQDSPELVRLKSEFGWSAYELDREFVGLPLKKNHAEISFPSETWDDWIFNEEGMGAWADIRLEHINAQMIKYGISTIWEVGSGNGAVCLGLARKGHESLAVEPLYSGARFTASKGLPSFACTLEELSLPTGSLSAVGAFDVLEHIEDPHPLLKEFARVLSGDGMLFITVPAHPFLFSGYDSSIGHYRRYTSKEFKASLERSGFELVHFRHLFAFLVPIAWLARVFPEKLSLSKKASTHAEFRKQLKISRVLEPVFRMLSMVESIIQLPFGLSILAVARTKVDPELASQTG